MSDSTDTTALALELAAIVAAVPGVDRVQPRPGISRLARQVLGGVQAVFTPGSETPLSPVVVTSGGGATSVEVDVAIARGYAGPVVVRTVAAAVLDRLAAVGVPEPRVDVRIVSL